MRIFAIYFILLFSYFKSIDIVAQEKNNNLYIIDTVKVKGLWKTKSEVIYNNITLKTGDTLNPDDIFMKIEESEEILRNLEIFTDVFFENRFIDNNRVVIKITIKEKWTLVVIPLYSYDNIKGTTYKLSLKEDNFFGKGFPMDLTAIYNKYDKRLQCFFSNIPIFRNKYLLSPRFYYYNYKDYVFNDKDEIVYLSDEQSSGLDVSLRKNYLNRKLSFELTSHIENSKSKIHKNTNNNIKDLESYWREGISIKYGKIRNTHSFYYGGFTQIWCEVAPLKIKEYKIEIAKKQFISFFQKSVLGLRMNGFYYSVKNKLFNADQIRGIKIGEIRGNYGYYFNFEYRQHLFDIRKPTLINVYLPLYFDVANAQNKDKILLFKNNTYTTGIGSIFNFDFFGGILQFNFGLNLPRYIESNNFKESFYFSISTGEIFFCNEKCNWIDK